ncbi:MAG TPA: isovaleryl-CoA dehydrogenase [Casimicrobiaceae bacterium]|nr:isovaleryl-CoA dehydrogenase [Casimicrobiaceae bacterium]
MTPFPNQPPPYEGRNLYRDDRVLREAVEREGAQWAVDRLTGWGEDLGRAETYRLADAANRHPPTLRSLDRRGERIDAIDFHPAWHELMRMACTVGEHSSPWCGARNGAQTARAAMYLLHAQVENGTQCPLTMTYAGIPALRAHAPDALAQRWLPKLLAVDYDPREMVIDDKRAALIGMGMTERQGGSDVRATRTQAVRQSGASFRITGHKWFFSAPQCDAHLVLARDDGGIGCFLVPRILDDGTRNAIGLVRLKDKLGNRSNASAEVKFDNAVAFAIGEAGRGIPTILEMIRHTRLDCAIGSAGMMRATLAWAMHHAAHRVVAGKLLIEQPLMQNVLADLALESEAATTLVMRLARTFESNATDAERASSRVVSAAAKYWICKRGPAFAAEALEALGGNGYIEDSPLARFYREMPVNSIWEGSGSVIALDVLRAMGREDVREALFAELDAARRGDARYDACVQALHRDVHTADTHDARRIAQSIAVATQASLLIRHAPAAVADAFCASRLGDPGSGAHYGALPRGIDGRALVERALPP